MARRAVNARGAVEVVELSAGELAGLMRVRVDDLLAWEELVPAETDSTGARMYRFRSPQQLRLTRERIAVLRTRMSIAAVRNVEAQGRLSAYAALAEDCPPGITAHVYRSFLVLILVQQRTGLMLDAPGLAQRAGLMEQDPETGEPRVSVGMARKHLRLLQAVGLLENAGERWEFSRIPACATGGPPG